MIKERPILFSAPMVRAILDGRKTQTRRVVKPQPSPSSDTAFIGLDGMWRFSHQTLRGPVSHEADDVRCPYGQPGDRLWVRETWRYTASSLEESRAITEDITSGIAVDWRATYIDNCMRHLGFSREDAEIADDFETWRPSIHMPRWASRILLEITAVRVERLNDISKDDAMAEGIVMQPDGGFGLADSTHYHFTDPTDSYCSLWESINGAGSWMENPWVWVVEFRRIER